MKEEMKKELVKSIVKWREAISELLAAKIDMDLTLKDIIDTINEDDVEIGDMEFLSLCRINICDSQLSIDRNETFNDWKTETSNLIDVLANKITPINIKLNESKFDKIEMEILKGEG